MQRKYPSEHREQNVINAKPSPAANPGRKGKNMKTINCEQFVSLNSLIGSNERKAYLAKFSAIRNEWTALDILKIEQLDACERLEVVLHEALIDAQILHEFACRCAERALTHVDNPDQRSIAAIEIKRKWLHGECSYNEFLEAWRAACDVIRTAGFTLICAAWAAAYATSPKPEEAAQNASTNAATIAAEAAEINVIPAMRGAQYVADTPKWRAETDAAQAAWDAASDAERAAAYAARDTARDAEYNWQVAELIKMLEEEK